MRLSGPRMSAAFVEAVLDAGTDVVDVGLASTDELWFASGRHDLPGVMFTASHNPGQYNGIKFCHPGARPIAPDELVAIAERASAGPSAPAATRGTRSELDVLGAVRRAPARAGRPDRHPAADGRRRRRERDGRPHPAGGASRAGRTGRR